MIASSSLPVGVSSKGSVIEITCTLCLRSRRLNTTEFSRLRANRDSFHTRIASNGECFCLAEAIICLNPGLSVERPLSASSRYSLTTRWPLRVANSLSALSCADSDRSVSCLSDDTLAYSATFISSPSTGFPFSIAQMFYNCKHFGYNLCNFSHVFAISDTNLLIGFVTAAIL